ncbi:membrane protein [Actinoplanes cyaneus]|uniref:Membrane protein n=1 Tax=Actinoplanes cyaneus TaxID=52696 RepID=A0A919M2X5_9ACTN|nr:acyltransferase [Actinoplanes cyaneus]MCW2136029.1 Peptidoglycan/LPS O-acetylase OafA/YrhL, contains acyltransferase and SGNH-hydrolase domains [Actinoplanes cyaneus]GID62603.1 membrane protein [Actinoplanes cyaneus]
MRNRYLDLLRAAAILRVIVYHLFGWSWLSIVMPAMGVMFALAGSLTAASLEKRPATGVVTSRLRRLLPPLWLLGLLAVPVMMALGWANEEDGEHPFTWWKLAFWILPLGDPPGSELGVDAWEPLWYIRAYVWFIIASPVLWFLWKRLGPACWLLVLAPFVGIAVLDRSGFELPETADVVMWDFVTYAACWITGFAHRDGRLRRLAPATVVFLAVVLAGVALWYQRGHQGEDAWDLNDVSESQSLYSLAFVLLFLRWQPGMAWLGRLRLLDRAVTLLNARAVTVYLWHNLAIAAIWPILTFLAFDELGHLEKPVTLTMTVVLTAAAVLLFGWAEDLAARRRPRLWPDTLPAPAVSRPGEPAAGGAAEPVPSGSPVPSGEPMPSGGPVPAGWPEVGRDGLPHAGWAEVRDGEPVAGRPPAPARHSAASAGAPTEKLDLPKGKKRDENSLIPTWWATKE